MAIFTVRTEWAGYSRGYAVYSVEAATAAEAEERYWDGDEITHETIRDDTESDVTSVEEVL